MALEDWKKTTDEKGKYGNDYIIWEKENDRISFWGLTAGETYPKSKKVKVVYAVNPKNSERKLFENKQQAMHYVRAYMRTH